MESRVFLLFAVTLLAAPSLISAQNNINCIFQISGANYDCVITALFVPNDETLTFTITGQHQTGMGNPQVSRVIITNSAVPFIVREFFTTFTNLREYHYTDSVTATRIQNNAFQFAGNLHEITIARVNGLTLFENSLSGANALQRLNLPTNQLASLPQNLLIGLNALQSVDFSGNQIPSVADIFFRGQTAITTINLNNNNIVRLPNTLLTTNVLLTSLSAANNQIDQIGRFFLNNLNALVNLNLVNNQCVSQNWVNIGGVGGPTRDAVNDALQNCFNNYVTGGEWRRFNMELRGTARWYDEDNNLVVVL